MEEKKKTENQFSEWKDAKDLGKYAEENPEVAGRIRLSLMGEADLNEKEKDVLNEKYLRPSDVAVMAQKESSYRKD